MSANSAKGYAAEHAVEGYLRGHGLNTHRPRTTSYRATDTGDHHGLPLVLSTKNHGRLDLAGWVDELTEQVARSPWHTGLVVHKRRGRGDPALWYATTTLGLAVPLIAGIYR